MLPPESDEWDVTRDEEEGLLVALPSFLEGGYVEKTGIALVHAGEYITPEPGSEASISPIGEGAPSRQVANYYFPVEVEVVGTLTETEVRRIAQIVFDELETALRSLA